MILKFGSIALTTLIAMVSGCATPAPQDQPDSPKQITRGAVSGLPQHVGFYHSVNPDCSSGGLVQLQLKSPPTAITRLRL